MKIPLESLKDVERERGISYETLLEAMEKALASAYLRMTNADESMRARAVIDREDGDVTVYAQEVEVDPDTEEETLLREWEDTPADFGRVAAQTFKQVMAQRLREAERDITFGEYSGREGDIVTGIVEQQDHRYTDRKSTRLNSSHANISYAVFCLKKKKKNNIIKQSIITNIILI